eukprot:TRINITY_DN1114_c0_g1_i2.p1 TRINITY_DN1114_c0_g1~~TRINITY_DN1114_c0_g1_i2.p1  ORF type:complete len:206 (+),score=33.09 TRINITY_DN1114_c0_g1_i2:89-706(+)
MANANTHQGAINAKPPLKKIPNAGRRHICFARRRNGIFKKAKELSLLCDAEIALFVFSEAGQLFQFASHDMKSTLLRYDSMNGRIMERLCSSFDSEQSSSLQYYEVGKEMLARKIISLEKSQRNITGEDLDSLTLEELNYLEKKMDRAVRRITRQKLRAMWDEIRLLKGQVRSLEEENKKFRTMVSSPSLDTALKLGVSMEMNRS